jgi:hypothetical protein
MESYSQARLAFGEHCKRYIRRSKSSAISDRRLKACFGVSWHVGAMVVYLTNRKFGKDFCPVDKLLIGLRWLKTYCTESNDAFFFDMDEKSIRKWRRIAVAALAGLDIVIR